MAVPLVIACDNQQTADSLSVDSHSLILIPYSIHMLMYEVNPRGLAKDETDSWNSSLSGALHQGVARCWVNQHSHELLGYLFCSTRLLLFVTHQHEACVAGLDQCCSVCHAPDLDTFSLGVLLVWTSLVHITSLDSAEFHVAYRQSASLARGVHRSVVSPDTIYSQMLHAQGAFSML